MLLALSLLDRRMSLNLYIHFDIISSDGSICVWDVNSSKEIAAATIKEMQLQEMKWDYTGSLLCSGLKNREYNIWDIRTSSSVLSWEVCLCFS